MSEDAAERARTFRERHRHYGEYVRLEDVELCLFNGWELILDEHLTEAALMRPPQPRAA